MFAPQPKRDPNLINPLLDLGAEPTNGFRTPADMERIKAQGYKPAPGSLHLKGDAVDLTPGRSGLTMAQLQQRTQAIADKWPGAKVLVHDGHVHGQFPGWGMAPGTPNTPNSGLPPLPEGFELQQRGSLKGWKPGAVHDGDTFKLPDARNARLSGVDAFELSQQGRKADGSLVPLGVNARTALSGALPGSTVNFTGGQTYGRPLVTLDRDGRDPGLDLIRSGNALATPEYLKSDPRFSAYMEAERLARQNLLGGHGTNAETPAQFRHKDGPWKGAEPAKFGEGVAVFGDEATPFQGLRPEVRDGYLSIWNDPKSKPEDLLRFAKESGFSISEDATRKAYSTRFKNGDVPDKAISYARAPKPLTNPGDGALGSFGRGVGDPINMLDEMGGVVDTLGLTGGRENVFNSERRFGDILWNNIDQNRSILAYDDDKHPVARIGGQLTSGLLVPFGGAAKTPFALARVGAVEGGLAGFGAGEGGILDRLPNAAGGAALGGAGGYALGRVAADVGRRLDVTRRGSQPAIEEAGFAAAPILNDGAQNAGPTPAARSQPAGGALAPRATINADAVHSSNLSTVEDIGQPGLSIERPRGAPEGSASRAVVYRDETGRPVGIVKFRTRSEADGSVSPGELETRPDYGADLTTYVDPAFRRQGVASRMYDFARQQGFDLEQLSGRGELTPDGAAFVAGRSRSAAMRAEGGSPTLVGPEAASPPPPPPGFTIEAPFGIARPMNERLGGEEIARLVEGMDPRSVLPRPSSEPTMEELAARSAERFPKLEAPHESSVLGTRLTPGKGRGVYTKGPMDLVTFLRRSGGIKDQGGELRHMGIDNTPRRDLDFAGNEGFLGRLVSDDGMTLDDATLAAWEAGYMPQFQERPMIDDFLQMLGETHSGTNRAFLPEDMAEVANFEGARENRFMIDAAESRGAPLHEDQGETISLDDLEGLRPPVDAYEDTPRLVGKIGNINLSRLENPGDIAQLVDHVSKRVGGFDAAKRGKMAHDETQRLAQEMGLKPEQLLRRTQGQALNAEQLYAVRVLAQKSREVVAGLAQKAHNTGADEDLLAFRKAWVRHVAIEEQVTGATAEAGRALQQFRMLAKSGDARGEAVRAYLKGAGGGENIRDAAAQIVDLMEDPAKASHFMREGLKPGWVDKFNELWVNSLLSGPKTHVVNFVGNAMTALYTLPEQVLTAGFGKVLRSADRSFAGEVGARVSGLANSAVEGLRNARIAFKTGEAVDGTSKIDANHQKAIGGRTGEALRLPTRALTAADEFWKTINRNAELHALSYRRAMAEAGSPAERKARYEQLLRNPDDGMMKAADNAAKYYTFQKELGPSGQKIQQWANVTPGGKLLLPFVRTPINLLKFAGERSIFAPLSKNVRAELAKGGRARDEALAKITLGSGLSTAAVVAAMNGQVTGGGPVDPGERMALLQSGWQPYSIKVGDRWVSYQRFDPLSLLFGAAADFAELGRYARPQEADQFALALSQAVAKNITSKTWLSGLSDAFDVMSDPQRYGEGYLKRMAGSLAVPALFSQVAQSTDPYMREARSVLDAIKARVPIVSKDLPVRRDIWGEPVERGDAVGPDLVSPIYGTHIDKSPLSQEIARLRVPLTMPKRKVTVAGERIDLNAEQYDRLTQLAGKPARTYLEGYIKTPEYRQMTDPERVDAVREIMKDFRKSGVDALKGMYPELGGNLGPRDIRPLPPGFTVNKQQAPQAVDPRPVASGGGGGRIPPPPGLGSGDMPPLPPGFTLQDGGRR